MHALHQRWTAPCAPSQAMRAQNLSCVQHAVAEAAADRVVERRRAGRVMGWSLFYYFLSMVSSPPQGRGPGTFALQRTKLCLPPLWSTPARAPLFTMALRVAALNVVCATALEHTCQGILREQLRKGKLSALGWTEAAACVCTTRLLRFKAAPQAAVGMPPLPGLSAAGTAAGARCHPGRRAEPHNLTAALCPGCRTGRRADRPYPNGCAGPGGHPGHRADLHHPPRPRPALLRQQQRRLRRQEHRHHHGQAVRARPLLPQGPRCCAWRRGRSARAV